MTHLLRIFGSPPPPSSIINPTDTVLPVPYWDDRPKFRHAFPVLALRFDNVLDPTTLQTSLATVFELGPEHKAWRRLAGRIRRCKDGSGRLELHIPASFTKERPAFSFSHTNLDVDISEHPLGMKLPSSGANKEPLLFDTPPDLFEPLFWDHKQPRTLEGFLSSDRPALSLNIVSFGDATLVSLTWAHVVCDAMAIKSLVDAWSLVLAGRHGEVLPASFADPMAGLGLAPAESLGEELASQKLGFWGMLVWLIMLVVDAIRWRNRGQAVFAVCIPRHCVERMRARGMKILESTSAPSSSISDLSGSEFHGQHTPNASFISAGDVLTAFCASLAAARVPPTSSRSVSIINVYSLRKRLPVLFDPSSFVYLQNAQFPTWTPIKVRRFFSKSNYMVKTGQSVVDADGIAEVAGELRRSIVHYTTPRQIDAFAKVERAAHVASGGNPAVFGEPSNMLVVVTNWGAGRFFDVDFSPAIAQPAVEKRSNVSKVTSMGNDIPVKEKRVGRPSWVHAWDAAQFGGPKSKALFHIVGTDSEGSHWLVGRVDGLQRDAVEKALKIFSI